MEVTPAVAQAWRLTHEATAGIGGTATRSIRKRIAVADRAVLVGDIVGQDLAHDSIKPPALDSSAACLPNPTYFVGSIKNGSAHLIFVVGLRHCNSLDAQLTNEPSIRSDDCRGLLLRDRGRSSRRRACMAGGLRCA